MKKRDLDIILNTDANWNLLKDSTVLVTGATGRLGVYFVKALLQANKEKGLNINVIGLARNKQKIETEYQKEENLSFIVQDTTSKINHDNKIDYIIHTAGLASPDDFTNRPIDTLWGHVMGTKNVLDLAVETNCKKVLYISTVEIYGEWKKEEGIKENDMGPLDHMNSRACYSEAKRLCETMFECYKKEKGLDFVVVRLSHTFGPGISLDDGRAFAEFIRNAINGNDIVLQSDGSAQRTYTYVADAVGASYLALLNGKENYYNIANVDNLISIRDLATLICKLSKKDIKVVFANKDINGMNYLPFKLGVLDSTRIIELGWKPCVDIENAFKWTIESFEE